LTAKASEECPACGQRDPIVRGRDHLLLDILSRPERCHHGRYDLRGNLFGICPECGVALERESASG